MKKPSNVPSLGKQTIPHPSAFTIGMTRIKKIIGRNLKFFINNFIYIYLLIVLFNTLYYD
jgi:hypothetical protein